MKIPTVKSDAGVGLTVVSSAAKNIYREIEQDQKQEAREMNGKYLGLNIITEHSFAVMDIF